MDVFSFINQSAFYIAAVFVAFSCMIYTINHRNMEKPQTQIFILCLWIIITASVCNMVAYIAEPYSRESSRAQMALYISNYIFFLIHNMLTLFTGYYAFFATQSFIRMSRTKQVAYIVPFVISEFFIMTNPINHWSWTYDELFHFQRNWAEASIYISGIIYYLVALYYLLFRWYAATPKRKRIIIFSFLLTAAGTVLQYLIPKLEVELFYESLTCMGIMLAVENDDDRVDPVTRMYNRDAFIQDVRYYYDTHTHFYAVLLKMTNYDTYQKMPDAYDINDVAKAAAAGIRSIYSLFTCYRVTPACFVMIALNKDEKYADALSEKVAGLLKDGFNLSKRDERIKGVIMQVEAPEEVTSVRDLLFMCEMGFYQVNMPGVLKRQSLHELFERADIERAIRDGINEHNFDVYYQLVYTTKEHNVHSSEALLRLNDPKLGELLPKVFIPAAERNGMIDVLGEFVLREVCRFIKSGIPDKIGMKYINVNLSVLQCMQIHFVDMVKRIVNEEGVSPERINFEITESVAAEDYDYLGAVMRECKELGFLFSMEGYGSGYSNMYAVFSLNFDEIKLDKSMLWEADKCEQGRIIIENSIRMIHDMGLPVVAVGVETESQIEYLVKQDVEYLQGFYFSKPMPKKDIVI